MLSDFRIFKCSELYDNDLAVGHIAHHLIMGKGGQVCHVDVVLVPFSTSQICTDACVFCVCMTAWAHAHVEGVRLRARI